MPGDQSHGLMAYRSNRDEQQGIHSFCEETFGESWGQMFPDASGRVNPPHECIGVVGEFAHDPFFDQSPQGIDGKYDVRILTGVCEIVSEVRSSKILCYYLPGNCTERGVVLVMEGDLPCHVYSP